LLSQVLTEPGPYRAGSLPSRDRYTVTQVPPPRAIDSTAANHLRNPIYPAEVRAQIVPCAAEVIEDSLDSDNAARITIHSQVCDSLTRSMRAVENSRQPPRGAYAQIELAACGMRNVCSSPDSGRIVDMAGGRRCANHAPSSVRARGISIEYPSDWFSIGRLAAQPKSSKLNKSTIQLLSLGMTKHFRTVFFIAGLAFIASMAETAAAQSRPDTTRMTCAAARALVVRHGGIVLGTGPSLFDRYVNSRAYCMSTEVTEPAFVPTADNRQCFIGYTCREPIYGWD